MWDPTRGWGPGQLRGRCGTTVGPKRKGGAWGQCGAAAGPNPGMVPGPAVGRLRGQTWGCCRAQPEGGVWGPPGDRCGAALAPLWGRFSAAVGQLRPRPQSRAWGRLWGLTQGWGLGAAMGPLWGGFRGPSRGWCPGPPWGIAVRPTPGGGGSVSRPGRGRGPPLSSPHSAARRREWPRAPSAPGRAPRWGRERRGEEGGGAGGRGRSPGSGVASGPGSPSPPRSRSRGRGTAAAFVTLGGEEVEAAILERRAGRPRAAPIERRTAAPLSGIGAEGAQGGAGRAERSSGERGGGGMGRWEPPVEGSPGGWGKNRR